MGINKPPQDCFITDCPTTNIESLFDCMDYSVEFNNQNYIFRFSPGYKNSQFIESHKHLLKALLLNKLSPFDSSVDSLNYENLELAIKGVLTSNTPKLKLDNLLLIFFEYQKYEGAVIELEELNDFEFILYKNYFRDFNDYWFYLNTLNEFGYVTYLDTSSSDGHSASNIQITFSGLEYIINLQNIGQNSNKCFIAMSFSSDKAILRSTIKNIVSDLGYIPIVIDEIEIDNGVTINDAMIRYIRECRFLIADFSDQKHGVYFEAGFALGLGRKVIYTCSSEDFENTHFDTNHYPHIVYNSFENLAIRLKDKILAWIY